MNFLNSDLLRRFIAASNRTTYPPRSFAREVNKSHVAVSTYPHIVAEKNSRLINIENKNLADILNLNQSEAVLLTNFGNQQTTVSKQK